jgi:hypothetical protein
MGINGDMVVTGGSWNQRACLSLFQKLLKLRLTYEKGITW